MCATPLAGGICRYGRVREALGRACQKHGDDHEGTGGCWQSCFEIYYWQVLGVDVTQILRPRSSIGIWVNKLFKIFGHAKMSVEPVFGLWCLTLRIRSPCLV